MADQAITAMSGEAKRAEFESDTAADPGNGELWRRFVRFELEEGGGIEAARAVYERLLAALPDGETYMWDWFWREREFGDVDSQRRALQRWARWAQAQGGGFLRSKSGWSTYLKFEIDNGGGVERVRAVGEALLATFPMDPHAYAIYIRALAALSRHVEAQALARRGVKELSAFCRGHDEFIWRFMAVYLKRLREGRSTAWDENMFND
ncbi:hypothetical protein CFC21_103431 [Triticum aestivum]|uniref:Suppressor of forked domain-containing protein n=2 Tax=Triticum aestivum TaxID=4565 RepID=A0A3B6SML2_WHEAT|nr:hypothetical protein CFC21_103431 [Triticum aestivum]